MTLLKQWGGELSNLSRSDRRLAKTKARNAGSRGRVANSMAELELLFTVAATYKVDALERSFWLRTFERLGLDPTGLTGKCTERAKYELTVVDYDYKRWHHRYNSKIQPTQATVIGRK